jgi:hypothetical protein
MGFMWEKVSLGLVPLLPFPPQTLILRTAPNSFTGGGGGGGRINGFDFKKKKKPKQFKKK